MEQELSVLDKARNNDSNILKAARTEGLIDIDPLRWFVVVDDFKNEQPSLNLSLWGPIRPLYLEASSTSPAWQCSPMELTAYARTRDGKLLKRDHESSVVPRFLSLFHGDSSQLTFREILKRNLTKLITDKNALKTVHIPAAVVADSLDLLKNVGSTEKEVTPVEYCSIPCDGKYLIDLSRSWRLLSSIPVGDKRQSGPGRYYPSDPSIKGKFATPPKKLMKLVGQAIKEWDMIQEGDRLLLGLSGGKDSLALLHILVALQVDTSTEISSLHSKSYFL